MQGKMLSIGVAALGVAALGVAAGRHVSRAPPPTTTTTNTTIITTNTTTQFWTDQLVVLTQQDYPGNVKLQGEAGDWDWPNWQNLLEDQRRNLKGLDVSPDGSKIIAGLEGSVDGGFRAIIWNAISGEVQVLGGDTHSQTPRTKFFPDGQQIATSDTRFRIWNADTNAHIRDSADLGSIIMALAVFPDNIHVAGVLQGKWALFNTWSGALHSWAEPGYMICVDVFPDGERVAIGAPWNNGGGTRSGQVRVFEAL